MPAAARSELGPVCASRIAVYHQACETLALARIAADLALPGPALDLPRAQRHLDRIRALLGPMRAGQSLDAGG